MSLIKRLLEEQLEIEAVESQFPDDTDWNSPSIEDAMIEKMEKEQEMIAQSGIPAPFAQMYL